MNETDSAGHSARTDADASNDENASGFGSLSEQEREYLDYWERNLESALSGMDPETAITRRNNARDLAVVIVGGSTRDERAELIAALERRGFEVLSPSENSVIIVNSTDGRLAHPFAEADREEGSA